MSRAGSGLTLVAAMARNGVIGRDNALPWRIPRDLRRFRELTLGKPVLMGRLTFESIGRALPGRDNLVLTRRDGYRAEGCQVLHDLDAALDVARGRELMVIGGAHVYRQTLPLARCMHLTFVEAEMDGDAWFPEFDAQAWELTWEQRHAPIAEGEPGFRFADYVRA